ncbi:tetratricopeptide repeat protein [Malaciobacter marinus]|uniref:beta-lactamase n=3 Tax=Malaciobacter marinus TaxID=505249 RepID=A0A347TLQ1_9BACT|nr:tetratricopeptide repeat protein [Malaciobacter marinus]AXX87529.1 tetratricopeptide repeat protein [Malaciobacter marinus]
MSRLIKIVLIGIVALSFISCENNETTNKKEVKYKASLPMPEWDKKADKIIHNYYNNWHDAKKDPIPAMKIGYAYSEELKDYEKALEWYKYADSMIPLEENSYFACYALQKLKRYDEAISWCKKAIDLKWDKALPLLATVYEDNKRYYEAIKYYKQSYNKTKDGLSANNLGYLYSSKIKDYKEAEKWYKKAIRLNHQSTYQSFATFYHEDLKEDIKASAYSIALIDTKYTKSSVLKVLQDEWKIPNNIIQKGYELQLNSDEFPIKYKGQLGLP